MTYPSEQRYRINITWTQTLDRLACIDALAYELASQNAKKSKKAGHLKQQPTKLSKKYNAKNVSKSINIKIQIKIP